MYRIAETTSEPGQGGYLTHVEVTGTGTLKMPMPLVARFADGSEQRKATDRLQATQTIAFASRSPLAEVRFDPDVAMAFVEPVVAVTAESTLEFMKTASLTGSGTPALQVLESARRFAIADSYAWFRLGLMLYDGNRDNEALDAFTRVGTGRSRKAVRRSGLARA